MLRFRALPLAIPVLVVLAATLVSQTGHYHVVKKIVVGPGGADYIIIDAVNPGAHVRPGGQGH